MPPPSKSKISKMDEMSGEKTKQIVFLRNYLNFCFALCDIKNIKFSHVKNVKISHFCPIRKDIIVAHQRISIYRHRFIFACYTILGKYRPIPYLLDFQYFSNKVHRKWVIAELDVYHKMLLRNVVRNVSLYAYSVKS